MILIKGPRPQGSPGESNFCRYQYLFTGKHFVKTYRTKAVIIKLYGLIWEILGANQTEDLLVARNEIVSSFYYSFSYGFCTADFSKTVRSISMKFSGLIVNHKNLIHFFLFWWRHFRFWEIAIFRVFRGVRCPDFLSESIRDTKLKFSALVDKV